MIRTKHHALICWLSLVLAAFVLLIPAAASASEETVSPHQVSIDPDQPFPSVMFSDILKSMSDQVFWENGQLRFFERVRMTFLPAFQDPQHIAAYNPNTGAFLVSELRNGEGELVNTVFWEARQDSFPYWTTTAVGNSDPAPLAAGEYTLTWFIDGQAFWSLPFEVGKSPAESAYDQPNSYLEGPWSEWAYIYVPNGNLSQAPTFNVFLRDKKAKPGNWMDKSVELDVLRNGKLVAQYGHESGSQQAAKPWWISFEFALRAPDNQGFVPASELLAEGDYEIVMRVNDAPAGTYRYRADGVIPFSGRQDRESADRLSFLEGAQDRFYIQKQ
jgi:hypothetical protein